ncbi:MAG: fasciclin domain-containing protein [Chlamydiia bacterium]|nr:fasciclin domain-containing protein [Chlamydiia bacterium]
MPKRAIYRRNKEILASILKYHVVPDKVTSKDVKTIQAPTLNGKTLDIVVDGEKVTVNGATIEKVYIEGSDSVVHVIDKVVTP